MVINDGGLAFPRQTEKGMNGDVLVYSQPGMSLRAWLAGRVLPVLVRAAVSQEVDDFTPALIAREACLYADAMIAELEK
jgi:hypothetical protein